MAVSGVNDASNSVFLEDFLRLLLTQLTHQDPLKPMDNEAFLAQMAQFTTLQQTQLLNQQVGQVLVTDMANQALSLIGKTVSFDSNGSVSSGTVSSISFKEGQPLLQLSVGGQPINDVPLSSVVSVRQ
jgi:flagellar basal-body rod modification protein FlgD